MRLLWVKAGKLLPPDTGGKIRSYHLLRHLATRDELVLLSYYGGSRDEQYERSLRQTFPRAVPLWTGSPETGPAAAIHYLSRIPRLAPYAVTKFTSTAVRGVVRRWLADGRFDVAVCDFLSASLNFPARCATPLVLFQHNVESALWQRQARHERNPLKRAAFVLEAAKMTRYERAAVRRFPHVIAVSEQDRQAMVSLTESRRISVVPTGVDLAQYQPAAGREASEPVVLFLGSMDWEANVDAVLYFCRQIWPLVRAAVPGAVFRIVGRNPHVSVRELAGEGVEVVGSVPSVVEHLERAAVVVVPLRIGGGTRLKIFEAMAAGRAVVATSIGAEGLDVVHGQDILLADDEQTFAREVIALLRDAGARRRLEAAAALSASRFDWSVSAARFAAVLHAVAAGENRARRAAVGPARVGA